MDILTNEPSLMGFSIKCTKTSMMVPVKIKNTNVRMANFDRKTCVMILIFWLCVPTVDIISDLTMVHKMFRGPDNSLWVSGGLLRK